MTWPLQNAVFGTALILAAALLRRALGGRLIPEARLALWAMCLVRLLAPVFPASPLSLWGLLPRAGTGSVPVPGPDPAPLPSGAVGNLPAVNVPVTTAPAPQPVEPAAFPWETVVLTAWLAVGLALAAWYVVSWNRTRRAVAQAIPLGRDDFRYAALPKCARLREGVMDGAPLTFGAARPTVVVPPGLDGGALDCVLAHEAVHAKRRDNLWHYVMAAALVLYWWNPAVWLMARLLRRDIELACDRAAVKRLGAARRAEYAQTLVALATASDGPAFCQTFGRKAVEERIVSVMKFKKTTIVGAVLTVMLVLGVTVAFASGPKGQTASDPNGGTPYVVCTNPLCGVDYQHCHIDGEVVRAYDEYPGLLCAHPDCEIEGPHEHDGVQYAGQAGKFVILNGAEAPVESAPPQDGTDTLIRYPGTPVEELRTMYDVLLARRVAEGTVTQAEADAMRAGFEEAMAQVDSGEMDTLSFNPAGNGEWFAVSKGDPAAGTVTYHGRTFNRASLSAETLEWLDWYLALPEEDRLAVSYEPVELALALYDDTEDAEQPAGDEAPAGEQGLTHDPSVEDSAEAGDDIICSLPTAPTMNCGVEGCTETRMHQHAGDRCIALGLICPVEGCDIPVCHDHDGVTYYCNGAAHGNGVCDGSCRGWSLTAPAPSAAPVRADCYPSGNGHHETGGHHGNGHH